MKLLDIVHPAARTLVDIARSQDDEVGDGTTSVVILAGEMLSAAKPFLEEGIHPQVIIRTSSSHLLSCLSFSLLDHLFLPCSSLVGNSLVLVIAEVTDRGIP